MFDYTLHEFNCPYCGHTYFRDVGYGINYVYKGKIYEVVVDPCPNCGKRFLYGHTEDGEDKFIKMPADKSELEYHSTWMS